MFEVTEFGKISMKNEEGMSQELRVHIHEW
jgi:hypothetical protein